MNNSLYDEKIGRYFKRSMWRAAVIFIMGNAVYVYSEPLGSLISWTALGILITFWRFSVWTRRALKKGVIRYDDEHIIIQTNDGIEITVPDGHKDLFLSREADGDN